MKYGLKDSVIEKINNVFASFPEVDKVVLYGSRAKGNYKEGSDIDLVITEGNVNFEQLAKISGELDDLLLPYNIDLAHINSIDNKDLVEHIKRVGVVFYEKESGWKECKLEEVADVQTGPFGSQLKNEQYIIGGTPVVTVEHINNFRIVDFDYPSVTDEDRERLLKYLLKEGDIIFTRVGSVDLSAFVKTHQDGWMFSSRMLRVRPRNEVGSKFLSYFFQQKSFREYILSISVGATMPSINTEILKGIQVSYPPLPEQKAIAGVLSSLDDKIDLLHRQNRTLEVMAETLFRQRFIEEAEDDWEEYLLSDISSHVKVNVKPQKEPLRSFYHYSIPAFDDGQRPIQELGQEIRSNKYAVFSNTILISKLNPQFPRVWAIYGEIEENSICSTEFQVVKPKDLRYFGFVYFLLKSKQISDELVSAASGTSGSHQRVKPDDIFNIPFSVPDINAVIDFSSVVLNSIKKTKSNTNQIRTLEKLRDTLLPKLMSGEVRVK